MYLLVGVVTLLHFAWYVLCALGRVNRAYDVGFAMSPLDPAESDDEGWEEREASRTHSVKFTEDVDPGGTEPGKEVRFPFLPRFKIRKVILVYFFTRLRL